MKKTIIITLFSSTFLLAQTIWKVDPMHSKLSFSTEHHGISEIADYSKNLR